jgi:hypothetical protein
LAVAGSAETFMYYATLSLGLGRLHAISFPGYPLANIGRTVPQGDAVSFASCQKIDRTPIHEPNLAEIQHDFAHFVPDEFPEFRNLRNLKASAESKLHSVFSKLLPFDLEHGPL